MLPIDKTYLKTNLINWKTAILDPAYIIQKETLPTASAQNLGKVFQYIGSDSTNYTIGGFYQCQVVSGTDPTEYAWVEITSKTSIDNTTIKENSSKQLYVPKATSSTLGVVKAGDGINVDSDGVISVVARLEEIAELPTAAAALEGKIYLLTDTQTGYDRGGIYMCEESTETAGTYEWKLISMSPLEAGKGITIEDDVISADTNIFPGTLDEWEALTPVEQAKYDFVASPEEDGATDPIYTKTITGTTTPSGNVSTGLNAKDGYYVLSIWANINASPRDSQYSAIPLTDNNLPRRQIYAHCMSLNGTPYADKSVDLTIVYKRFTKTTTE